ncbi:hypothetical protein FSJ81_019980, partial [Escherichia coli]|nr:hypothetical protein [Escherichia coli]
TRTDLHRCYSPISFTVIRNLAYMEANGYRNVLSLKMFGLGLPVMLKEYGLNYEKRHTKQGIQTNLTLKEESYGDWLPKCDDPATA